MPGPSPGRGAQPGLAARAPPPRTAARTDRIILGWKHRGAINNRSREAAARLARSWPRSPCRRAAAEGPAGDAGGGNWGARTRRAAARPLLTGRRRHPGCSTATSPEIPAPGRGRFRHLVPPRTYEYRRLGNHRSPVPAPGSAGSSGTRSERSGPRAPALPYPREPLYRGGSGPGSF